MNGPDRTDDHLASGVVREQAHQLAKCKLKGQAFVEAKGFIWGTRRRNRDIFALIKRLEGLPDLSVPEADRRKIGLADTAEGDRMRAERAAGASMRELSQRYGVSTATVSRVCKPRGESDGQGDVRPGT